MESVLIGDSDNFLLSLYMTILSYYLVQSFFYIFLDSSTSLLLYVDLFGTFDLEFINILVICLFPPLCKVFYFVVLYRSLVDWNIYQDGLYLFSTLGTEYVLRSILSFSKWRPLQCGSINFDRRLTLFENKIWVYFIKFLEKQWTN